jgi:hypothetical protein
MTTAPQFVEVIVADDLGAPTQLVAVSDIKRVYPGGDGVHMQVLTGDGDRLWWLVEGSYEKWRARLGVRRASEVDGRELAEAVSRYEQEARA